MNLYKKSKQNRLVLMVTKSHYMSMTYYCHIELDFKGKIVAVKDEYHKDVAKVAKLSKQLLGKVVDLNTFEHEYEKEIHSRAVGVESSDILGRIDESGKVIIYNRKNAHKLALREQYVARDKMENHGNYPDAQRFQHFINKYRHQLNSFSIHKDSITYYRYNFTIGGLSVGVTLEEFFNYKLSVRVYGMGTCLELKGSEIDQLPEVIEQFTKKRLSPLNKVKIITRAKGISYGEYLEVGNVIKATLRFDGWRGRPKGKYTFEFDMKNKTVNCPQGGRSKKFIPQILGQFQKQLKQGIK